MTTKRLSLEDKIKKEMERQLIVETQNLSQWVSTEIKEMKNKALNRILGIRTSWGSLEFDYNSEMREQIKKNAQFSLNDFVQKFNLDEMELTPKEIKELQKSYRESYILAIDNLIDDYASKKASEKFDELIEKLDISSLEE
jgi:hypothetical protein